MNVALWILQVLLAALFLWHGWLFLSPPAELVEIMNKEFALWFRIFLGVAEVLAAIGLIVPGATCILPSLDTHNSSLFVVRHAWRQCEYQTDCNKPVKTT
ncbi:MAG TPA: DoxX family protein [Bacteroidota bacterium]